jgi:hypothetical protein
MEKTLKVHFEEWQKAVLDQIDKIDTEDAKKISSDYFAATLRLKMAFQSIVRNTKPPL